MNKNIKKITAITIMLALLAGCFATMPLTVNAAEDDIFDTDGLYTIRYNTGEMMANLGHPELNGRGEIFPISVVSDAGKVYHSYCAHGGSERFAGDNDKGCRGYMVATMGETVEIVPYADFLAALNCIVGKFGSPGVGATQTLADNRVITQTVIWVLLGAIETDASGALINVPSLEATAKANIENVLADYDQYKSQKGPVTDFAYLLCETHSDNEIGLRFCQPQLVPLSTTRIPRTALFSIEKTVNGIAFNSWLEGKFTADEISELRNGIEFELREKNTGKLVATGKISDEGLIAFTRTEPPFAAPLPEGEYEVAEKLTNDFAKTIFKDKETDPLTIYVNSNGIVTDSPFDYNALYTIVNGYHMPGCINLEYTGLSYGGNIFYIAVKNTETLVVYPSFCADAGSLNFAGDRDGGNPLDDCAGYMIAGAKLSSYADLLKAYNYIETKFGSDVADNRVVTQVVTWILIGAEIELDELHNIDEHLDDIRDVLANYESFEAEGKIADLVYMVCENHEHTTLYCQPQLVPVYRPVFNNEEQLTGSITVKASVGTKVSISGSITGGYSNEGNLARDKQPHNLEVALDGKGNWFQYNELTADKRVPGCNAWEFDLVQGDKLNKVGSYTIEYIGNNKFIISSEDPSLNLLGAKVSISNTILAAKNKNDKNFNENNIWTTSPGQQQFSGSGSSFEICTPKAIDFSKRVFVYIHLEGLSGYINTNGAKANDAYTVTVTNNAGATVASHELKLVAGSTLSGQISTLPLPVGIYTISVTAKKDGTVITWNCDEFLRISGTDMVKVTSNSNVAISLNL